MADNRLVVFSSDTMHEVLEILCPSGAYADSRFAVTSWLHQTTDSNPEAPLGWGHFRGGALPRAEASREEGGP